MATVFKPPQPPVYQDGIPVVFLAGSIDMGRAETWQARVEAELADRDLILLNPRREDWDSSWVQSIENAAFRQQVVWELEGLERADWILMHFAAGSQAPITLLELGLTAASGRLIVACAPDYWRRGNIEVVCARYGLPLFTGLDMALAELGRRLA